jgi:glycine/D-amino acid oxidase-like deaminating enzyme
MQQTRAGYPDVVVIGGGIVGCACAYYLARAGVGVRLLERGSLGSGASKAGMSHIVTWEEPDAHLELARASLQLYIELCEELPEDIEYRQTGSLVVVEDEANLANMAAMVTRLGGKGVAGELLNEDDLRRFEPNLATGLPGGVYFPGDGQVNPLITTQSLAHAARVKGASIDTQVEVNGIEISAGRVTAVLTGAGRIPAAYVVIAAGAWSSHAARMGGVEIPVQPRKGTIIVTYPVPEDRLHCKITLSAGYMDSVHGNGDGNGVVVAANIQQVKNGNLLLGSSRQFNGYDLSVDAGVVRQVLARCLRIMPALSQVQAIRMWSGLRPYTPDLLPIIGSSRRIGGLFFATGHEGIGITEAPITGKLISQMITGEEVPMPLSTVLDHLSPDRFFDR